MHYAFRFLIAALAVWRITHLLSKEDGPWDLMARLRKALGRGVIGTLFGCFYCLSVWVALPFAVFVDGSVVERLVVWFALSGAAILLERAGGQPLDIRIEDE